MTEPTFGWRLPVAADIPDVPYDMGNLAADIAATLQTTGTRVYRESTRAADSTPGSATLEVAPAVTITAAPVGLYMVQVWAQWSNTDTTYHSNNVRMTVAGNVFQRWRADNADAYRRTWTGVLLYQHDTAADLSVRVEVIGSTFVVYSGSGFQVARISS